MTQSVGGPLSAIHCSTCQCRLKNNWVEGIGRHAGCKRVSRYHNRGKSVKSEADVSRNVKKGNQLPYKNE